ncbi:MAG: DUF6851 domain-containing protein, partial [Pseudomonadota bacterium]
MSYYRLPFGLTKPFVLGSRWDDALNLTKPAYLVKTFGGDDAVTTNAPVFKIHLGKGDDSLTANSFAGVVNAGRGDDDVRLEDGAFHVAMGRGDDTLSLAKQVGSANGGRGTDTVSLDFNAGEFDVTAHRHKVVLLDRFTGEETVLRNFETFEFADRSFTAAEMQQNFGRDADVPFIQVGGGTQTVTVNDADPSISVIWDRVVQQAVIETGDGPTVASRAYAMMHTAMYDAWSAFDADAVTVSFDLEGDNIKTTGGDEAKAKAMSFAAITVLRDLFPGQEDLYVQVMQDRLGYQLTDDGSVEAQIGIDAAEDLLALRAGDGSNQSGGYADTTGYTPYNPSPLEINDITRWTPENVPVDPEDGSPEQSFLTPQWGGVEGFAVPEDASNENDFASIRPEAPQKFFTAAFSDATLDVEAGTITLGSAGVIDGVAYSAGDVVTVSKALIGEVINQGFITQAEEVVAYSANLTDEQKIIAEFWEDGGGTAFPPGTWMTFGQFVSARDGNT